MLRFIIGIGIGLYVGTYYDCQPYIEMIENFIEQTSTVEILRSINRSYIAVGYTDEEIIEFKRELSEVISFGKQYLNNMWASEKIYYESESNKIM